MCKNLPIPVFKLKKIQNGKTQGITETIQQEWKTICRTNVTNQINNLKNAWQKVFKQIHKKISRRGRGGEGKKLEELHGCKQSQDL